MQKILIVGELPSGLGGMETVLGKFNNLMTNNHGYNITFLIFGTPSKTHELKWLTGINYKLVKSKLYFRFFKKRSIQHQIMLYVKDEKPSILISYDPLSALLAQKSIEKLGYHLKLISWSHFSFNSYNLKNKKRLIHADYHWAICKQIKQQMINYGVDSEKIYTINNPISKMDYTIKRNLSKTTFLYMGRIQYKGQKNIQEMFYALARLTGNFSLEIVGSGNEVDLLQLKTLANTLHIADKINWHGWQHSAWDYVGQEIKTVSALLLTSTYEGFPMALGEAMARGIYCISADCETGPTDIIKPEINGALYHLGNVVQLAKFMQCIINGQCLPGADKIQASIDYLYDEAYSNNIKNTLDKIMD